MATVTDVDVTPVWSLNALGGIDEDLPAAVVLLPDPAVVVVDDELVELHAAAPSATTTIMPNAVDRPFHDAERKAPPSCRTVAGVPPVQHRADTNM